MKIPAAKAAVDQETEKLEKILAWDLTKVRNKSEVIDEARTKGAKVHFASLMDICHLKNAKLEAKQQKYKGRVVLRGDTVKDNSGSYAVFAEQGSSASQMTAAKVMDIISRLPGCAGQAADAVSACTQVKMEDVPQLLKIPKPESTDIWDSSTTTQMAKIMLQYGRPSRSSWTKSLRSSFGRTGMGKAIRENPIEAWLGEYSKLWMSLCEKGLFLLVFVDEIKLTGKTENVEPTWKILMRDVDLGEPTSFLDYVDLGCTQRECQISNDTVDKYRSLFKSRVSAGAAGKLPETKTTRKHDGQTISSWSRDMEGHAKKCVERSCEIASKTTEQLYKVATPLAPNTNSQTCWPKVLSHATTERTFFICSTSAISDLLAARRIPVC